MNVEKILQDISKVNPGRYDLAPSVCLAIVKQHAPDSTEIAFDSFYYGFLQGQKAAKAQAKRAVAK